MIHNFIYTLKILGRKRMLIFWTWIFPLLLGTFFQMAFASIETNEALSISDIALIEKDSEYNDLYLDVFDSLSQGDDALFNITKCDEEKAKQLLVDDKINGYVVLDDELKIQVRENGIDATILKQVCDEININVETIEHLSEKAIEDKIAKQQAFNVDEIIENVSDRVIELEGEINDQSKDHMSYTMIEFYSLIAMAALYGGVLGIATMNICLANMSHQAKRIAISPTHKLKQIISGSLASYFLQIVGIALLFIYTIGVLKVDYGPHLLQVILLALMGSFAGLWVGIAIACIFPIGEDGKTGILISYTMLCSFLSGMMGITMKYFIDSNIPILNQINPVAMITDGLYSLYYYQGFERYYFNMISLAIFSLVMLVISYQSLRRSSYEHL